MPRADHEDETTTRDTAQTLKMPAILPSAGA